MIDPVQWSLPFFHIDTSHGPTLSSLPVFAYNRPKQTKIICSDNMYHFVTNYLELEVSRKLKSHFSNWGDTKIAPQLVLT